MCSGETDLLQQPWIKEIAAKHKKTPAQVLLRYLAQRHIAVLPKSSMPSRIKENAQVRPRITIPNPGNRGINYWLTRSSISDTLQFSAPLQLLTVYESQCWQWELMMQISISGTDFLRESFLLHRAWLKWMDELQVFTQISDRCFRKWVHFGLAEPLFSCSCQNEFIWIPLKCCVWTLLLYSAGSLW